MWKWYFLWGVIAGVHYSRSQFYECHDDPSSDPEDGPLRDIQFTWLGLLQYIHVKNGTPHYFRVPRVVLISRQFVLSTAVDAAQVPEGYALGNVAFGEYERDEKECGLTVEMIAAGAQCSSAVLLMPLADVLLHPEFKHFGTPNSIALLKMITPIQSRYMLPACLPFRDFLTTKYGRDKKEKIFHIDFVADAPRDIVEEEKEVSRLSLLPRELCYLYGVPDNKTDSTKNRIVCTTGCGFHSGAPSIVHEHTGHWSIVSLSQGGSPCPDPLRVRRPPPPPHHIYIYPYVPWITTAITGKAVGAFAKDDPFGFVMPRRSIYDVIGHGWFGHWWMGGIRCFDRGDAADDMFKFYHEVFQVKPSGDTNVNYFLELFAPSTATIICIKVGMPFQIGHPAVWDLDSSEVKIMIPLIKFKHMYKIQVEGWAYNSTHSLGSDTETTSESGVSSDEENET